MTWLGTGQYAFALLACLFHVGEAQTPAKIPTVADLDLDLRDDSDLLNGSLGKMLSSLPGIPEEDRRSEGGAHFDITQCVISALGATYYLAQTAMEIAMAVKDCKPELPDGTACIADISGSVMSFLYTGGYIASMATGCSKVYGPDEACAANVNFLVAGVAEATQAAALTSIDCDEERYQSFEQFSTSRRPDSAKPMDARRLTIAMVNARMRSAFQQVRGMDPMALAWCILDAQAAVLYLAQAVSSIVDATTSCAVARDSHNTMATSVCVSNIFATFANLGNVVAYIGGSTSYCNPKSNPQSACAAWTGSLVNGLANVGAAGASMVVSCDFAAKVNAFKQKQKEHQLDLNEFLLKWEVNHPRLWRIFRKQVPQVAAFALVVALAFLAPAARFLCLRFEGSPAGASLDELGTFKPVSLASEGSEPGPRPRESRDLTYAPICPEVIATTSEYFPV